MVAPRSKCFGAFHAAAHTLPRECPMGPPFDGPGWGWQATICCKYHTLRSGAIHWGKRGAMCPLGTISNGD